MDYDKINNIYISSTIHFSLSKNSFNFFKLEGIHLDYSKKKDWALIGSNIVNNIYIMICAIFLSANLHTTFNC